jgi:succinoglycan biosynthesis transport protein ExoP
VIPHDAGLPDPSVPLPHPHPREAPPIAGRVEPAPVPFRPAGFTPPAPPALSAAPDLMGLLACLRQRWAGAVLLGGTLAAIAAVGVWFLLKPKPLASAMIRVEAYPDNFGARAGGSPNDFKTYLMTTAGAIKSLPTIQAAVKRDEVRRLNLEARETDPVQAIYDDLRVEFKENSELVTIYFNHSDPAIATTVANAIKLAFVDDIMEGERTRRSAKFTKLEKSYNEADEGLKARIKNRDETLQRLKTVDPKLWREQRLEVVTALRDARTQATTIGLKVIEARSKLDEFDMKVKLMRARPAEAAKEEEIDLNAAVDQAMDTDPEVKQLTKQLLGVEELIDDWEHKGLERTRPTYASYKRSQQTYQEKIAKRKAAITERVKSSIAAAKKRKPGSATPETSPEELAIMRAQLKRQVDGLVAKEKEQDEQIKELGKEAARVPTLGADYERDVEEVKQQQKTLDDLRLELERARVAMKDASRISGFQDAQLVKQDSKKQLLATGVAPIAVLGGVSAALAWLEFRKRRVRSAAQISRGLGIRVVGAVPHAPYLSRQLVGPEGESELAGTPVMESIDAIRTRLLHEAQARSTRLVMVTSATSGEGKTTLAAALAASLARAGRKTLLLDGDLRRPAAHDLFEVAPQPGLSEVLLGEIEVAEVAVETAQENLFVVPAGQWDREVLHALARDGLEGVFEKLADEFDFILIDSHPVLAANDSLLIGRQVDAVLLSVLREVSEMPRVYAAAQQLEAVGARVLGAVVNASDPEEVFTAPAVASAA